ncbi:YrhK family protein [Cobetia sp. 10Alg 146]|uniref:YrhK family protein n=1 Tax=Cobetia sp. 10Alg 146 TaxID=3040019 RepID=UPI00244C2657|nr:YrhK family protein [Cobetia sp. 10Alg 146]MDH2290531.1 YrhK family protein [Cobetia sp. 10Alg 146]
MQQHDCGESGTQENSSQASDTRQPSNHSRRALQDDPTTVLTLRLGHEELVIHRRYELASIINELVLGLLFTIGSVCFFWDEWMTLGIWLFVIGSLQLTLKPLIRLARRMHLKRLPESGLEL